MFLSHILDPKKQCMGRICWKSLNQKIFKTDYLKPRVFLTFRSIMKSSVLLKKTRKRNVHAKTYYQTPRYLQNVWNHDATISLTCPQILWGDSVSLGGCLVEWVSISSHRFVRLFDVVPMSVYLAEDWKSSFYL